MTETKKEHMKIPKIEKGIVIDHIPVGRALLVAQAIGLDRVEQNGPVTLGLNFESRKMGKKDLIKVEHLELARQELEKIASSGTRFLSKEHYRFHCEGTHRNKASGYRRRSAGLPQPPLYNQQRARRGDQIHKSQREAFIDEMPVLRENLP